MHSRLIKDQSLIIKVHLVFFLISLFQSFVNAPLTFQFCIFKLNEAICQAIALIKKAVASKVFTSPHNDVDKYTDAQLFEYVTTYAERLTK